MFIRSLTLRNILSFGEPGSLPLRPLNIFIGANASGKSNLIDCIGLLRSLPGSANNYVNDRGGADSWIWKGKRGIGIPTIRAEFALGQEFLTYEIAFTAVERAFGHPIGTVVNSRFALPGPLGKGLEHLGQRTTRDSKVKRPGCPTG
jgi:predicted ATPase